MSITMIRGYGLPSDTASMYNGYAGGPTRAVSFNVPNVPVPQRPLMFAPPPRQYPESLFRPLPDPELGYGSFGNYGISLPGLPSVIARELGAGTSPGVSAAPGMGTNSNFNALLPVAIGLAAAGVALFFFLKK